MRRTALLLPLALLLSVTAPAHAALTADAKPSTVAENYYKVKGTWTNASNDTIWTVRVYHGTFQALNATESAPDGTALYTGTEVCVEVESAGGHEQGCAKVADNAATVAPDLSGASLSEVSVPLYTVDYSGDPVIYTYSRTVTVSGHWTAIGPSAPTLTSCYRGQQRSTDDRPQTATGTFNGVALGSSFDDASGESNRIEHFYDNPKKGCSKK